MDPTAPRERDALTRWLLVAVGVALSTGGFVGLIDEHSRAVSAWPWWLIGLTGVVLVLIGLGSPWSRPAGGDDRNGDAAGAPPRLPQGPA